MGTPHRGANLAVCAEKIVSHLKRSRLRVNTAIVAVLRPGSEVLSDVEDSFEQLRAKRDVHDGWRVGNVSCFFEEDELPVIGKVLASMNQT